MMYLVLTLASCSSSGATLMLRQQYFVQTSKLRVHCEAALSRSTLQKNILKTISTVSGLAISRMALPCICSAPPSVLIWNYRPGLPAHAVFVRSCLSLALARDADLVREHRGRRCQ